MLGLMFGNCMQAVLFVHCKLLLHKELVLPYQVYNVERKYNGNENGHIRIYQFPFQIFSFPFSFPLTVLKFFPLTDISVNVNVNHTAC